MKKFFFLLFLSVFWGASSYAQEPEEAPPPVTRILFVFDGSYSMFGQWQSDVKINIARKLMSNLLDSLASVENLQLALRVYGHQHQYPPQVCNDTRLEVPFGYKNTGRIKQKLERLIPKGTTPIAYALSQVEKDFPPCSNCRNIVILITDGIEECDGDPCAVSRALQKKGITLKPFVIGIGRDFSKEFECVGTYFDASGEVEFSKALKIVISQVLNSTTTQVNLLDDYNRPTETNVNMSFYDHVSGKLVHNYIHTFNANGVPDTLYLDPLMTYDMEVHTIPSVRKENVEIVAGQHTTIAVPAGQGGLRLVVGNNSKSVKDMKCIVRKAGDMETLNVQTFGTVEYYLTGYYDLEILSTPRIYVDSVRVTQSHTTSVEMPLPGIAVLRKSVKGYGSIYLDEGEKLEHVYNLQENDLQESLLLQPGNYRVIFRSRFSSQNRYTIEKRFSVKSGITTNVKLFSN
ncbi:MAG: von willebrand factor type a [Bacteroidetes bacterium]|nr:MAG: von willebrand factor type a [Bacteroidota bacterium]